MNNGFSDLKPELQQEFTAWSADPELSKLLNKLRSQKGARWLDHYAEAMIARYLLGEGCSLKVEVETPSGKGADFKVDKSGEFFFVHIKRMTVNDVTNAYNAWCYKQFKKLQELEKIPLPIAVVVNLKASLNQEEATEFIEIAKLLIEQATEKSGQFKVRSKNNKELGECEVYYPVNSNHVVLCPDSPDEPVPRDSDRFISRLNKAYKQFMPGAVNIILFSGEGVSRDEFESALFGEVTLVRDKKTNQFVKTINRQNGFWSGKNNSNSYFAVWFEESDNNETNFKLWIREGFKPELKLITELFAKSVSLHLPAD